MLNTFFAVVLLVGLLAQTTVDSSNVGTETNQQVIGGAAILIIVLQLIKMWMDDRREIRRRNWEAEDRRRVAMEQEKKLKESEERLARETKRAARRLSKKTEEQAAKVESVAKETKDEMLKGLAENTELTRKNNHNDEKRVEALMVFNHILDRLGQTPQGVNKKGRDEGSEGRTEATDRALGEERAERLLPEAPGEDDGPSR